MEKRIGYVYEYKEDTQGPCLMCGLPLQDSTYPICDECSKTLAEYSDLANLEVEQAAAQVQPRRAIGKHGKCGGIISYAKDESTWYLTCSKCKSRGSTLLMDLEDF